MIKKSIQPTNTKNKKLIISLFVFLLISLSLVMQVSAERYIKYEFKEGIISESGQLTETNKDLTNIGVLGYVCLNSDCSQVGEKIFDLNSGSSNEIELTYPTNLKSNYGYAVYFYKPGYITWEQNPNWWGTNPNDPQGPYTKYLSKKQNCHAPIESFSIINEAEPNIPVYITAKARLDAETYSAIFHSGPLNYIPSKLENYYKVQTRVYLLVYDEFDNLIHSDNQELFIDFSGSEKVEFTWTPSQKGKYKVVLKSIIEDNKCTNSQEETASKELYVFEEKPQNVCYTILNNLETSNKFPNINDIITVSFTKISNYIDNNYILTPLKTKITYELRQGQDNPTGNLVYSNEMILGETSATQPEKFQFSLSMPSQIDWYTIYITGICHDNICNTIENTQDIISESIYVGSTSNHAPTITSTPITFAYKDFEYEYDVDASDPDNDPLTYILIESPSKMEINPETGLITWIPKKVGNYKVTVKVNDNKDGYDTQTFTLKVDSKFHKKHLFKISSVNTPLTLYPRDDLEGFIQLKNIGHLKEKDIDIKISLPEFGIEYNINNIKLNPYDTKWLPFKLEIPYTLEPGEYLIKVEAKTNKFTDTKFSTFKIKNKFIFNF